QNIWVDAKRKTKGLVCVPLWRPFPLWTINTLGIFLWTINTLGIHRMDRKE
ncbi:hypothetical protein HMPREF0083_04154, partial [Aneurinibacillus aneurinilyticus ATCC 12856]